MLVTTIGVFSALALSIISLSNTTPPKNEPNKDLEDLVKNLTIHNVVRRQTPLSCISSEFLPNLDQIVRRLDFPKWESEYARNKADCDAGDYHTNLAEGLANSVRTLDNMDGEGTRLAERQTMLDAIFRSSFMSEYIQGVYKGAHDQPICQTLESLGNCSRLLERVKRGFSGSKYTVSNQGIQSHTTVSDAGVQPYTTAKPRLAGSKKTSHAPAWNYSIPGIFSTTVLKTSEIFGSDRLVESSASSTV